MDEKKLPRAHQRAQGSGRHQLDPWLDLYNGDASLILHAYMAPDLLYASIRAGYHPTNDELARAVTRLADRSASEIGMSVTDHAMIGGYFMRYTADRLQKKNQAPNHRTGPTADLLKRAAWRYLGARVLRWRLVLCKRYFMGSEEGRQLLSKWEHDARTGLGKTKLNAEARLRRLKRIKVTGLEAPHDTALAIVARETDIKAGTLQDYVRPIQRSGTMTREDCKRVYGNPATYRALATKHTP